MLMLMLMLMLMHDFSRIEKIEMLFHQEAI